MELIAYGLLLNIHLWTFSTKCTIDTSKNRKCFGHKKRNCNLLNTANEKTGRLTGFFCKSMTLRHSSYLKAWISRQKTCTLLLSLYYVVSRLAATVTNATWKQRHAGIGLIITGLHYIGTQLPRLRKHSLVNHYSANHVLSIFVSPVCFNH